MPPSNPDISADLLDFVTQELLDNRPGLTLGAQDDLLGSGLVNSLGVMRLIQFMEQQYKVDVPPADVTIENFGTVQAMDAYLRSRGI